METKLRRICKVGNTEINERDSKVFGTETLATSQNCHGLHERCVIKLLDHN